MLYLNFFSVSAKSSSVFQYTQLKYVWRLANFESYCYGTVSKASLYCLKCLIIYVKLTELVIALNCNHKTEWTGFMIMIYDLIWNLWSVISRAGYCSELWSRWTRRSGGKWINRLESVQISTSNFLRAGSNLVIWLPAANPAYTRPPPCSRSHPPDYISKLLYIILSVLTCGLLILC